jgi:hypothetical protein
MNTYEVHIPFSEGLNSKATEGTHASFPVNWVSRASEERDAQYPRCNKHAIAASKHEKVDRAR